MVVLRRALLGCVCLATLLSAHPAGATARSGSNQVQGSQLAGLARQLVGAPYAWGGASPAGFDCTGFVMWVYGQFGISLPRSEAGQLGSGPPVGPDDLQPGDVVVFANTYKPGLSHTGIYVGDGRFVHAGDERHGVYVSSVWDGYWGPRFAGASRAYA